MPLSISKLLAHHAVVFAGECYAVFDLDSVEFNERRATYPKPLRNSEFERPIELRFKFFLQADEGSQP
jgi:hypothetical protein